MIIIMKKQADEQAIFKVINFIKQKGLNEHVSRGEERMIIGAVGDERVFDPQEIEALPQVERAIRILSDWRIISRDMQEQNSVIRVRGIEFGNGKCLNITTHPTQIKQADALFADPFFVSNHPYTENSLTNEKEQIRQMKQTVIDAHEIGKPVLVRIRDVRQISVALDAQADILYFGGELMQNRMLHEEVGRLNTPIILCKDKHHLYSDWLTAAEHIALKGNHQIILGEAGTLSFANEQPHRLDIEAIVRAQCLTHLPIIADISQLWHNNMPQEILFKLAQAVGVSAIIHSLKL